MTKVNFDVNSGMALTLIHRFAALTIMLFVSMACSTSSLPVPLMATGDAHTCAYDSINSLTCWGDNSHGQVTVPTGLTGIKSIASGTGFSCAAGKTGVRCWGLNDRGQTAAPSLSNVTAVSAGYEHACALHNGGVTCWGANDNNQLTGQPAFNNPIDVQAGGYHTCVLDNDGVKCWGLNDANQTNVPALTAPSQLAAGGKHNCVNDGGDLVCWGDNSVGQLDNLPAISNLISLSAGAAHTCIVDDNGVQCWGDVSFNKVLSVRELTWPKRVTVGGGVGSEIHACAYHQQAIACWGDNSFNQATYPGTGFSIVYRAEVEIDTAPANVWSVLMDLENYPLWNPFTIQMNSTLQVGDPMIMRVKMSDTQILTQTEHIRVLEPNEKVCWGVNNNIQQYQTGERCQWLEPLDGGLRTRYVTEDLIAGKLTPTVKQLYGNSLRTGFDGLAAGLKARAEALF